MSQPGTHVSHPGTVYECLGMDHACLVMDHACLQMEPQMYTDVSCLIIECLQVRNVSIFLFSDKSV